MRLVHRYHNAFRRWWCRDLIAKSDRRRRALRILERALIERGRRLRIAEARANHFARRARGYQEAARRLKRVGAGVAVAEREVVKLQCVLADIEAIAPCLPQARAMATQGLRDSWERTRECGR